MGAVGFFGGYMTESERQYMVAMMSAMSCLISELNKAGVLDFQRLIENIQGTAIATRKKAAKTGDAGEEMRAIHLHGISEYLLLTVRDPQSGPPGQNPPVPD